MEVKLCWLEQIANFHANANHIYSDYKYVEVDRMQKAYKPLFHALIGWKWTKLENYQSERNFSATFIATVINNLKSCRKNLPEFINKFAALAPAILQDVIGQV